VHVKQPGQVSSLVRLQYMMQIAHSVLDSFVKSGVPLWRREVLAGRVPRCFGTLHRLLQRVAEEVSHPVE
jgi:hypothetical protein